jgi:hypothetical protein
MMIRAYRMRGHLHADLDPLGLATAGRSRGAASVIYGFTEADWDRKIFIDNVLGLEYATIREMLDILKRTYCSTLASSSCISPIRPEVLDPGAHRGSGQGHRVHRRRQEGDPQQADRGRRFREVPRRQIHRHQAVRPGWRRSADPGA